MDCTLAIKMRIEVLKRKPNSTRLLDYLTFLTLTLNSIDDLKIKFFPFTTKPRDAAQKRSEAGESGNVKLEPHWLRWEQAEITKKQQFIQRVSFHRASSTVSLDRGTESFRTSFSQCFASAFLGTYTAPQTVSLVTLHRCGICLETLTDTATLEQTLSLQHPWKRPSPSWPFE